MTHDKAQLPGCSFKPSELDTGPQNRQPFLLQFVYAL